MSEERQALHSFPPQFAAYVYPGWHRSTFRPHTDEWDLLDNFSPYFDGHLPPLRPLDGRYDDADPSVTARQIARARRAGIGGFLYFLYYGPKGFVLSAPIDNAVAAVAKSYVDFGVTGVWCVRLPHERFPLPGRAALECDDRPPPCRGADLAATPLELLTLGDIEELFGPSDPIWSECVVAADRGAGSTDPGRLSFGLTLGALRRLLEELAAAWCAAAPAELGVLEARRVLGHSGLGDLTVGTLAGLLDVVSRRPRDPLNAAAVTELERVMAG